VRPSPEGVEHPQPRSHDDRALRHERGIGERRWWLWHARVCDWIVGPITVPQIRGGITPVLFVAVDYDVEFEGARSESGIIQGHCNLV